MRGRNDERVPRPGGRDQSKAFASDTQPVAGRVISCPT